MSWEIVPGWPVWHFLNPKTEGSKTAEVVDAEYTTTNVTNILNDAQASGPGDYPAYRGDLSDDVAIMYIYV